MHLCLDGAWPGLHGAQDFSCPEGGRLTEADKDSRQTFGSIHLYVTFVCNKNTIAQNPRPDDDDRLQSQKSADRFVNAARRMSGEVVFRLAGRSQEAVGGRLRRELPVFVARRAVRRPDAAHRVGRTDLAPV